MRRVAVSPVLGVMAARLSFMVGALVGFSAGAFLWVGWGDTLALFCLFSRDYRVE